MVRPGPEPGRAAERRGPGPGVAAELGVGDVPFEVVADVEVEVAVAVEVRKRGRGRPVAGPAQPGAAGDVLEGPVAPVAIEGIRVPACDEEVRAAVVVVVADRDAVPIPAGHSGDPGAVGGVLEGPVPSVM